MAFKAKRVMGSQIDNGGRLYGVWVERLLGVIGLGETHLFPVPCLTAPANAFSIDDARPRSAASWVISHGYLQNFESLAPKKILRSSHFSDVKRRITPKREAHPICDGCHLGINHCKSRVSARP